MSFLDSWVMARETMMIFSLRSFWMSAERRRRQGGGSYVGVELGAVCFECLAEVLPPGHWGVCHRDVGHVCCLLLVVGVVIVGLWLKRRPWLGRVEGKKSPVRIIVSRDIGRI
jgi:hypothetical protein